MPSKTSKQRDGITRRGKVWAYRLRVPDPETGGTKQILKSGFTSEKEAKEARDKARAAIHSGTFVTPNRVTVEEFLNEWIELHALSLKPATAMHYRNRIALYLVPRIGKLKLTTLRATDIQKLYRDLLREGGSKGQPLSATSVMNVGAVLKKALQYAVDVEALLPRNPASRVPLPKGESTRQELWTSKELKDFLEGVDSHRLFAFFRVAAYTGARRSEVLGLRWSDLDLEQKRLTIARARVRVKSGVSEQNSTKGGSGRRDIQLDSGTVEILKAHRKAQLAERLIAGELWTETGYLFVQEDGQPIDLDTPTQVFSKYRKELGLPAQRLHDLRHIHATELLRSGVPLHVVADRLGHRDPMVTATIYAHVRAEQAESTAEIFAQALER